MARLSNLPTRLWPSKADRISFAPKATNEFYKTREWLAARAECIAVNFGFCAHCGRRPTRLFVDHIVELQDGGAALDQGNLEPLCGSCHSIKTAKARGERMAARPGP